MQQAGEIARPQELGEGTWADPGRLIQGSTQEGVCLPYRRTDPKDEHQLLRHRCSRSPEDDLGGDTELSQNGDNPFLQHPPRIPHGQKQRDYLL